MDRAHCRAALAERARFLVNGEIRVIQENRIGRAYGDTGPTVIAQVAIYNDLKVCITALVRWRHLSQPLHKRQLDAAALPCTAG